MGRISWRARRSLITTHRVLGLTASLFVVVLSLTGLLLNHPERFQFLEESLRSNAILRWYGLTPKGSLTSFAAADHVGSSLDRGIYFDAQYLAACDDSLIGFVRFDAGFALASPRTLWLIALPSPEGRAKVVDRMDSASLPGSLSRVGTDESGSLLIETEGRVYRAGPELLNWYEAAPEGAKWSGPSPASETLRTAILEQFRGEGLLWSRLIADLHTGRIFGRHGEWVMDGAAVVLLMLVATGLTVARVKRY